MPLPLARLSAPVHALGTTGLRQLQAVHAGSGLQLARTFVYGKLKNQRNLVKYYHKYRKRVDADFTQACADVERKFEALIAEVRRFVLSGDYENGWHQLFAYEGQGGNLYWQMCAIGVRRSRCRRSFDCKPNSLPRTCTVRDIIARILRDGSVS